MKKVIIVLVMLVSVIIIANTNLIDVNAAENKINIVVNGNPVVFTEDSGFPYVENYRTMVPLRVTMEAAGAAVGFDFTKRVAIIITENSRIEVPIDTNILYSNNLEIKNDTKAIVKNGRTFLPIRAVLEAAGFTVEWDAKTSTVNAYTFKYDENLFVPYSTSSLETLVKEILKGNVVYINGQYYATPQYVKMLINTKVIYIGNDLNTAIYPQENRYGLAELDLSEAFGEWLNESDLTKHDISFSYGSRIDGQFRIDIWSFKKGNEQIYLVPDISEEFIKADNMTATFNEIRMKKEKGTLLFYKDDLIKRKIIN